MNIRTWQERWGTLAVPTNTAMQAEIDELRAALQECDAEIEGWKADQKENLANQCNLQATINAQRNVLEQALEALRYLSTDSDGNYIDDDGEAAITAIQEQLE